MDKTFGQLENPGALFFGERRNNDQPVLGVAKKPTPIQNFPKSGWRFRNLFQAKRSKRVGYRKKTLDT